jgi:hypothetical protein
MSETREEDGRRGPRTRTRAPCRERPREGMKSSPSGVIKECGCEDESIESRNGDRTTPRWDRARAEINGESDGWKRRLHTVKRTVAECRPLLSTSVCSSLTACRYRRQRCPRFHTRPIRGGSAEGRNRAEEGRNGRSHEHIQQRNEQMSTHE